MGIAFDVKSSAVNAADVYVVIDGKVIALPKTAKYICQDKRGCWYYCTRRPRIKNDDWTPNKSPIQIQTDRGHARVLRTELRIPWEYTLQSAVKRELLPV